jgi:hypothetical protein
MQPVLLAKKGGDAADGAVLVFLSAALGPFTICPTVGRMVPFARLRVLFQIPLGKQHSVNLLADRHLFARRSGID